METVSHHFVLYALVIVCNEFILKGLCEGWLSRVGTTHSLRTYAVYRLVVFSFHNVLLGLLFHSPLSQTVVISAGLTLLGCSELVSSKISNWVFKRTQRTTRPLHLTYIAFLAIGILTSWNQVDWQPRALPGLTDHQLFDDTMRWVFVYFLASIPTNYIIRWLVNKPEDATFPDMIVSGKLALQVTSDTLGDQSAHAATSELSHSPSLKGGRIIGVLERWIVIALLARGEMAAIGFVFAAKSIVRYHDFTKPDFAEYYLIGTLFSVLIAMGLSALL